MNEYDEFVVAMEEFGSVMDTNLSEVNKYKVGNVWGNVKTFLTNHNLVTTAIEGMDEINKPTNVLNATVSLSDIGPAEVLSLVESCNIPVQYTMPAARAVTQCINKYKNPNMIIDHFSEASLENLNNTGMKSLNSMFSERTIAKEFMEGSSALESFGASVDQTLANAKVAVTITLMKFHKNIMPRFIPHRSASSNVVTYDVISREIYDLSAAAAATSAERNEGSHRIPFVELYADPSTANTEALPIFVKDSNDVDDQYIADDGWMYPNVKINMFDMAKDAAMVGGENIDYSDLVGEGVKLTNLKVQITEDVVTEEFPLSAADRSGAKFVMTPNASDSAIRLCSLELTLSIKNNTNMSDGNPTAIFASINANTVCNFHVSIQGSINLRTGDIQVMQSCTRSTTSLDGTAPLQADVDFMDDDIDANNVTSYQVDAVYSEENIRRTSKAMRVMTRPMAYEIPASRNVLVQYSLIQPKPTVTIEGLAELLRIGNDDRGIKLIMDCINNVYNRIQQENLTPGMSYTKKVQNDFAAGGKVLPYIHLDTIDIDGSVANMRSAEALGDVRGYVEKQLLEMLTVVYNQSLFQEALAPGERTVIKVLTSGYILNALLAVPYYNTILDQSPAEKSGDAKSDYKRILPNGTELQIITSNFDYLADKMIMVPVVSDTTSELNFAHLADRGTLIMNINSFKTSGNAGMSEIIANAREIPIVTNPVALICSVTGLGNIFQGIAGLE